MSCDADARNLISVKISVEISDEISDEISVEISVKVRGARVRLGALPDCRGRLDGSLAICAVAVALGHVDLGKYCHDYRNLKL